MSVVVRRWCETGGIAVFMPAYNAAGHLADVIGRVPEICWNDIDAFWIINDGSVDETAREIEKVRSFRPVIRGVSFESNCGYGHAVREGLKRCAESRASCAVCLHSDGQYPPEEIPRFFAAMQQGGFDVLQGSRIASGTALSGGMPVYKYGAGKCLTFFENMIFKLSMTDYHSGYMWYSRRALERIPFNRLSRSFDFDLEVIATALSRGMKVGELPIPTRYAGECSYLNPVTYGMRVVRVMLRYLTGYYRRLG